MAGRRRAGVALDGRADGLLETIRSSAENKRAVVYGVAATTATIEIAASTQNLLKQVIGNERVCFSTL